MDGRGTGEAIRGMMFALFFGGLILGSIAGVIAFAVIRWAAGHVSVGLH